MPTILTKISSDLAVAYSSSDTWHVALINDVRSTYTWSVVAATDVITTSAAHTFIAGTRVQLSSTGSLPTSSPQVIAATDYLVVSPSGSTLQLTTVAGVAIDFTSTGSGILTITDVAPTAIINSVAEWVRKEVASYDGLSTRPVWVPPSPSTDTATGVVSISQTLTLTNTSGTLGITFNKALLIKNGTSARGNTTGTATEYFDFATAQLIQAGAIDTLVVPVKRRNAV